MHNHPKYVFAFLLFNFSCALAMNNAMSSRAHGSIAPTLEQTTLEKNKQNNTRASWYQNQTINTGILLASLEVKHGLYIFYTLATLDDINLPLALQFANHLYQDTHDEHYKQFADAIRAHQQTPWVLKNIHGAGLSQMIKWTHIQPKQIQEMQ